MDKNLLYWLLYDAGNSFVVSATGGLYLAQWLVLDKGVPEAWYGAAFSVATVFVLLTSPIFGAWSDKIGNRKNFVNIFTFIIAASGLLMIFGTNSREFSKLFPIFVLFLFFLIQYAYQLSLVFFNALLEKLSIEKTRGKISGLSMLFNQFAFVFANAALLPFALGKITLFGTVGRSQVFLPAFLIFIALSAPFVFLFKEKQKKEESVKQDRNILRRTIEGIKLLYLKEKNVGLFLLGFSFVSDALLTISLYFALIMNELYKIPDEKKFIAVSIMFLFAAVGGLWAGKAADMYGIKKVLLLMTLFLVISFFIAFISSNFLILLMVLVFAGIGWGGFYSLSRALLIKISPKGRLGEYFGFYSTFERFASIIGPTLWAITITLLSHDSILKYRVAGFSQLSLMFIGIVILLQVKGKRHTITKSPATMKWE